MKKIVALIIVALLVLSGNNLPISKVYAADSDLKICMGDSNVSRHHKAVVKGEETEELFFCFKRRAGREQ